MSNIYLTHRALRDIQSVRAYSTKEWGKKRADEYIRGLQDALKLLGSSPELLKTNPHISEVFVTYGVQKHWLICDKVKSDIYVLSVKHMSLSLLERLRELQPTLDHESKILSQRLRNK